MMWRVVFVPCACSVWTANCDVSGKVSQRAVASTSTKRAQLLINALQLRVILHAQQLATTARLRAAASSTRPI